MVWTEIVLRRRSLHNAHTLFILLHHNINSRMLHENRVIATERRWIFYYFYLRGSFVTHPVCRSSFHCWLHSAFATQQQYGREDATRALAKPLGMIRFAEVHWWRSATSLTCNFTRVARATVMQSSPPLLNTVSLAHPNNRSRPRCYMNMLQNDKNNSRKIMRWRTKWKCRNKNNK